jgi:Zn-dependent peptidase ImmA (M78 family)
MQTAEEKQLEADANEFAMCLLMPRDFLVRDFTELCPEGIDIVEDPRILKLAERYKVTPQMMMLRLVQLELIRVRHTNATPTASVR